MLTLNCKLLAIRKSREGKRLLQGKLAQLADISNNAIVNIEAEKRKNPALDTLRKISKALNASLNKITEE